METSTIRSRSQTKLTPSRAPKMMTPEYRDQLIREKAYLLAEQDHFTGSPVEYWLKAEHEIDERF